ncbi:MAG: hypothetical protein IJI22_04275 [Bacilli bacterium]|nr:hypothetical protein [Bacilli bacterium]
MKDAFGGIMNLFFIAVFMLIVSGSLALVVSYTKAFKMKNEVISVLERNEASGYNETANGNPSGCFAQDGSNPCTSGIKQYAESIGYSPYSVDCSSVGMADGVDKLFCYKCEANTNANAKWYGNQTVFCTVTTQVDINFPIINKILGLSFFRVHGDTRVIQIPKYR